MDIGGKERSLVFDINALSELAEKHGVNVLQWEKLEFGPQHIRAILFVGLKYGAKKAGEKFSHTLEEVGDWMTLQHAPEVLKILSEQNLSGKGKEGAPAGE